MTNGIRAIRVIKRNQKQELGAAEAFKNVQEAARPARQIKTVVSAWVREWQDRSATERRPTFNSLFREA